MYIPTYSRAIAARFDWVHSHKPGPCLAAAGQTSNPFLPALGTHHADLQHNSCAGSNTLHVVVRNQVGQS